MPPKAHKPNSVSPQPYFFPLPSSPPASFNGSTLILPVVSLANVPQLAVDLLIHGSPLSPCHLVGALDPVDHIPVVGAVDVPADTPAGSPRGRISLPIEVYQSADRALTIVQQRAPVLKAQKDAHVRKMKAWIAGAGFAAVLVLVSVDAATRADRLLQHPTRLFHILRPQTLAPTPLRQRIQATHAPLVAADSDTVPLLSAAGLARRLLAQLTAPDLSTEVNALVTFVAEGDNRDDARALAAEVLALVHPPTPNTPRPLDLPFSEPLSWKPFDRILPQTQTELFG